MNDTAPIHKTGRRGRLRQRCARAAPARARHSVHRAHAGRELSRPARQPRQLPRQHAPASCSSASTRRTRSSLAHGYARVTGKPLAVALHANVGLMHATMAIFNAWCDRIPIVMLGGVGPLDAMKRRPWVDWIHTSRDLGALIRDYIKWDDQPGSVAAALESIVRAHRIAMTLPRGPDVRRARCRHAGGGAGVARADAAARPLSAAARKRSLRREALARCRRACWKLRTRPLIMIGRVSNDHERLERARGTGRAHRRDRADRHQDGRELSDRASASPVPAEPLRDGRGHAARSATPT